jgi:hypothetical protein
MFQHLIQRRKMWHKCDWLQNMPPTFRNCEIWTVNLNNESDIEKQHGEYRRFSVLCPFFSVSIFLCGHTSYERIRRIQKNTKYLKVDVYSTLKRNFYLHTTFSKLNTPYYGRWQNSWNVWMFQKLGWYHKTFCTWVTPGTRV